MESRIEGKRCNVAIRAVCHPFAAEEFSRSHVPGRLTDRRFAVGEAPIFTYRRFAQTAFLSPTLSLLPPSFNQNLSSSS